MYPFLKNRKLFSLEQCDQAFSRWSCAQQFFTFRFLFHVWTSTIYTSAASFTSFSGSYSLKGIRSRICLKLPILCCHFLCKEVLQGYTGIQNMVQLFPNVNCLDFDSHLVNLFLSFSATEIKNKNQHSYSCQIKE